MAKHLSKEEIISRLKLAKGMMKEFVEIDLERSRKFLDPSVVPSMLSGDDGENISFETPNITADVPIGQSNLLTASLLVKLAVVAINRPDWHVVAQTEELDEEGKPTGNMVPDPDSALIWRQYMRDEWDRKNWQRIALMTLLKRYVSGLGCVRWCWGENGVRFEHLQSWDYGVDPFLTDWQRPDYGRCRIRISLNEAAERYPDGPFKKMITRGEGGGGLGDKQPVEIEIYWDENTEAHIYENEWLIHKDVKKNADPKSNLYSRVPFLFLEGDLHPGKTPFPIGDAVLASGAQAQISDLDISVSNTAKAGAGMTLIDTSTAGFNKAQQDALEKGEQQQIIGINGLDTNNPPVLRIPGEELRQSVLQALKDAKDDMLSLIGISQMDLGLFNDRPQFATQVAATVQKGGARQNQARSEYETFLNRWAGITLMLFKEFGGPYKNEAGEVVASNEHVALHDAAMRVTEIKVVESSTAYKDPSIQQQQSMQLVDRLLDRMPIMVNLADMGLMTKLPNIEKAIDRMFRAFDINQTEQMWIPYERPQAQPQEETKPLVPYKEAPPDVQRQIEERDGYQPSQIGFPETPDYSAHVDLEKQARDHLHETGMLMSKQRHEKELATLAAAAAKEAAKAKPAAKNGAK